LRRTNREFLQALKDGYEITNPIVVEVAASDHDDYHMVVVNLHNEQVFGIGETKKLAEEMLQENLIKYFEELMSSDLNHYRNDELIYRQLDKDKLQRSIRKIESKRRAAIKAGWFTTQSETT
jgi:hypothetical protein